MREGDGREEEGVGEAMAVGELGQREVEAAIWKGGGGGGDLEGRRRWGRGRKGATGEGI